MTRFDAIMRFSGFSMEDARKHLSEIQSLKRPEFEAWQKERQWAQVKWFAKHLPWYAQRLGGSVPDRWDDVPILSRQNLTPFSSDLIAFPFRDRKNYAATTSGSSGEPFRFVKDKPAHAMTWALIEQRYAEIGLSTSDLQARFYGLPAEGIPRRMEIWKDRLLKRERFPVSGLDSWTQEETLKRFENRRFVYVYGYSHALIRFGSWLDENGIVLRDRCPSLKRCITSAEMSTKAERSRLANAFGVPVTDEYGSSEFGLMAIETPDGRMKLSEETILIESVHNADGHNRIVVTDLFNRAFPLIRYDIGDAGEISDRADHANGSKYLLYLEGRSNDRLVLTDGSAVSALALLNDVRDVVLEKGLYGRFQLIQERPSEFRLVLEGSGFQEEDLLESIGRLVSGHVGGPASTVIVPAAQYEMTSAGKLRNFLSKVSS